ncbi:unnamed protein product, partial [Prorocentrum cordatum]
MYNTRCGKNDTKYNTTYYKAEYTHVYIYIYIYIVVDAPDRDHQYDLQCDQQHDQYDNLCDIGGCHQRCLLDQSGHPCAVDDHHQDHHTKPHGNNLHLPALMPAPGLVAEAPRLAELRRPRAELRQGHRQSRERRRRGFEVLRLNSTSACHYSQKSLLANG